MANQEFVGNEFGVLLFEHFRFGHNSLKDNNPLGL